MAIYPGLIQKKKKPQPWTTDPSKLTTSTAQRQPSYTYQYQTGSPTQIRRQTTEQFNRPTPPAWSKGPRPPVNTGARFYQQATMPAGYDPTASQFPWQMRRGISSDVSRQAAYRYGFGAGEGRTGFARKSVDTFFDPRYMFDRNFRNWAFQQRARRRYG